MKGQQENIKNLINILNEKDNNIKILKNKVETLTEKLKLYEALGVDEFIYYATFGLGHKEQKRSLDLFINKVMPEFLS